jgi:hypothetical protein
MRPTETSKTENRAPPLENQTPISEAARYSQHRQPLGPSPGLKK